MNTLFFVKGLLTGLAIAAPVGPTTVLVVHRALKQGFKNGLLSGLGAATADAFYGFLATAGVGFITGFIYGHEFAFKLVGGCFLLYWGIRILGSRFTEEHPLVKGEGAGGPLVSTFILTLTNPMTLVAFMAILAGLGATRIRHSPELAAQWVFGLATGSFLWWLVVSFFASRLQGKVNQKFFKIVNLITGAIVIAASILVLLDLTK